MSLTATRSSRPPAGLALAALTLLGLTAPSARAQVVLTPADSNVGAPGAPGGGTPDSNGTFVGNRGGNGYSAQGFLSPTYTVNGPAFTGGAGGAVVGTDAAANYQGGDGGDGLYVGGGAHATINSGTFTGGVGGAVSGVGSQLSGGYAGSGLDVNGAVADVFGGTFQGGDSGPASGTGQISSQFAGFGLNANNDSTVNVYGGTFTGGNNSNTGGPGDGLIDLGGNLNVYGGTFTGGTGGFGLDVFVGNTTLYGSDFFVNGVAYTGGPITGQGTITGDLADNSGATTFTYRALGDSFIQVDSAPVPEASSVVSLSLLLMLGLGGAAVARRKSVRA